MRYSPIVSEISIVPSPVYDCSARPLTSDKEEAVFITPIVTRYKGVDYAELGAGGGHGDLDQIRELELHDVSAIGNLMELCSERLQDRPEMLQKVMAWIAKTVKQGGQNTKINLTTFLEALYDKHVEDEMQDIPLDRLVSALERLVTEAEEETRPLERKIVRSPYLWTSASMFQ